ncbi:hypothetical protein NJ959_29785, partial [Symplocastrum sp. BBK-W-15]
MIEALKTDEIVAKAGGRFKLCALIQRRLGQLMDAARPLADRDGPSAPEAVADGIRRDGITPEFDGPGPSSPPAEKSNYPTPHETPTRPAMPPPPPPRGG